MAEQNTNDIRMAVLIDADNVSSDYIKSMMEEIARYGNPTVKRIYGDWTKPNLIGWKKVLLDYAISPVQQFGYTSGKNSTDSAMIIDAMDLLYTEKVDAFCLVSSDSDFTRLATRLREAGKTVYGMGEQKTPNAFIAACDRFIYIEILEEEEEEEEHAEAEKSGKADEKKPEQKRQRREKKRSINRINRDIVRFMTQTIRDVEDENGWAYLGEVGNLLVKKQPSFDPRNYGFSKLSNMLKAMNQYELDIRDAGTGSPNSKHIFVRVKKKKKKKKNRGNGGNKQTPEKTSLSRDDNIHDKAEIDF